MPLFRILASPWILTLALATAFDCGAPPMPGAPRPDSEVIEEEVARFRDAMDSLDVCTPAELASAVSIDGIEPAEGVEGAWRGRVGLGRGFCTLVGCHDRACCNGCGASPALWRSTENRGPVLMGAEIENRVSIGAMDCSIQPIIQMLNGYQVVVRGRFEPTPDGLGLVVERICRVE